MNDSAKKNPAAQAVYALLTIALLALVALSVFGETIPVNDGAGFDGEFYREVFRDFSSTFFSTGYDAFRIQRIFPFCLMNIVYGFAGIPLTNAHMINGMYVLLFLNIGLQLFIFFKYARFLKWKPVTTVILFALFFFNFPTLKLAGYNPFQTDTFAVTIALVSYYLLLRNRIAASYAVSLLGLVTWPVVTIINAVLILFKTTKDEANAAPTENNSKFGAYLYRSIPIAYTLGAGAIVLACFVLHKQCVLEGLLQTQPSPWLIAFSLVAMAALLWFLFGHHKTAPFPYTPRQFVSAFSLRSAIALAIPFIVVKAALSLYTNDDFFFDSKQFFLQIILRPLKFPGITVAGHVAYWGALPLMVLLFFRDFAKKFCEATPGHALAFLALAFFALDSEARHIAPFLPLMLVPLAKILDKCIFPPKFAIFVVILQLTLSHFYIPLNVEGFAQALESGNFYTEPAQRYFMNFGPWMNGDNFLNWLAAALAAGLGINEVFKHAKRPQSGK